jgi:urease accessory protein
MVNITAIITVVVITVTMPNIIMRIEAENVLLSNAELPDLRLMQLISPALPVGGFTYSQGMEWMTEAGYLDKAEQVHEWLAGLMDSALAGADLPVLARLYRAFEINDSDGINEWSAFLLACRETRELRNEELNRARALQTLLADLDVDAVGHYRDALLKTQLAGFALAAVNWSIPLRKLLLGYCWSWIENQVAAAIKLVPLGQTAGQKLLIALTPQVPAVIDKAMLMPDQALGLSSPMLALASSFHETQYTRLFRS